MSGDADRVVHQSVTGAIDADQELIGLGMANFGAGLFQGFPIGASLSKSAANDNAGAKTAMSLIVAALATALVALFFTPLFRNHSINTAAPREPWVYGAPYTETIRDLIKTYDL